MTYDFEYNGQTYSVPSFDQIPTGALRKARKADDEMDKAFTILEEALGVDSPVLAVVDSMTVSDFATWLEGWTAGVRLGESSDS
jgi:pyruvate dehydrogenase complex dehydrogenase (E1) component